ncbi:helix-turn-helix domain-containing protein [Ralstonia pseudosolanacearum]|uniref:AlbA family DNA-binding domain-containing protein n=1 Tax=Ralstonia pseudosolanacearum TaxID=1310165 RepID=UPI001181AB25|nr:ATP-binding protein [Ralstonia pseudosolanacearum]
MFPTIDETRRLLQSLSESYAVEVKRWFDPSQPDGQAKLIRALIALRNNGGGRLVIGFDNETMMPVPDARPHLIRAAFVQDDIQALVSRFASEPFEVCVQYVDHEGEEFPVICVPAGVRTPVATKSELKDAGNQKVLVPIHAVFVRTLSSNNTVSTASAQWRDWNRVSEICFDNREADIGRFLRRHITGLSAEMLKQVLGGIGEESVVHQGKTDELSRLLDQGQHRFSSAVFERSLTLPPTGFWDVAMVLDGPVPEQDFGNFMNLLSASNPEYTGWPVWFSSSNFANEADRPRVFERMWEALVALPNGRHIDFMQFDPKGVFYHQRALFDDLSLTNRSPVPRTAFDFSLPVLDSAEAIAVGLAFAKAMGCAEDNCTLDFALRWRGLRDRELTSWFSPGRYISPGRKAYQDEITLYQSVPLSTPPSAIGGLLTSVLPPLYALFNGFVLSPKTIEDLSAQLVERRAQI